MDIDMIKIFMFFCRELEHFDFVMKVYEFDFVRKLFYSFVFKLLKHEILVLENQT